MKDGFKERFFSYICGTLAVAIIVAGIFWLWPDIQRFWALKEKERDFSAKIEAKKAEIEAIKKKQMRFRTDREFVESIARQNNRVFPGELVFIFEKD